MNANPGQGSGVPWSPLPHHNPPPLTHWSGLQVPRGLRPPNPDPASDNDQFVVTMDHGSMIDVAKFTDYTGSPYNGSLYGPMDPAAVIADVSATLTTKDAYDVKGQKYTGGYSIRLYVSATTGEYWVMNGETKTYLSSEYSFLSEGGLIFQQERNDTTGQPNEPLGSVGGQAVAYLVTDADTKVEIEPGVVLIYYQNGNTGSGGGTIEYYAESTDGGQTFDAGVETGIFNTADGTCSSTTDGCLPASGLIAGLSVVRLNDGTYRGYCGVETPDKANADVGSIYVFVSTDLKTWKPDPSVTGLSGAVIGPDSSGALKRAARQPFALKRGDSANPDAVTLFYHRPNGATDADGTKLTRGSQIRYSTSTDGVTFSVEQQLMMDDSPIISDNPADPKLVYSPYGFLILYVDSSNLDTGAHYIRALELARA